MLMAVKNQFKCSFLAIKYGLMKEMLNRASFISSVKFVRLLIVLANSISKNLILESVI